VGAAVTRVGAACRVRRTGLALGAAVVAAAMVAAGCILTTGQFLVQFDLIDPLTVTSPVNIARTPVDLNTIDVYAEHKNNIHDLVDLAILGEITNTGTTAIEVEVWMTTRTTTHVTAAAVRSDPTAVLLWGPLALAPAVTQRLGWDESAATFRGRAALLQEVKGDGQFTLYVLGPQLVPTYSFRIDHGVLVLVIDGGI
jgi:hypothetical protein